MDEQIDIGMIVKRRRYPIPTPGIDVDYLWDPVIRADLLVRLMTEFTKL